MVNQPTPFARPRQLWYAQAWVRWLAIWLIGVGIGLPLMLLIAEIGGGYAVNIFVRSATIALNGSTLPSYMLANAITTLLIALIPGATSGAVIGFAQWMLLPQRLRPARTWILASACGGAIAWWAANILFIPIQDLIIGFLRRTSRLNIGMADIFIAALVAGSTVGYLGGVIAGGVQWFSLRRVSPWTIWWIIVSAIGWSSMWAIGAVVLALLALQSPIIVN
jgi:hypothetical protein